MSAIYFIPQQTVLFTIPLMIMALDGMFSERGGVTNTALEGTMIMGVLTSALFLNMTGDRTNGQLQLLLAILISVATGAISVLFHVYTSINMKVNQAINRIALNMLAPAFVIFVARVIQGVQQIQFSNAFRIEFAPLLGNTPLFGPLLFRNTYIITHPGIAILVLSTLAPHRTRFGLRLRSCGEHPRAVNAAGINAYRIQYIGTLISGVLGGLGKLVFVMPTSINFSTDVAGYGFLALVVLIFGQWKSVKIMWVSLFFGLTKTVAAAYSGIPFLTITGAPSYVYKMIPYLTTPIVLVFTSRNLQAPRAPGVPYNKGQRWVGIYTTIW